MMTDEQKKESFSMWKEKDKPLWYRLGYKSKLRLGIDIALIVCLAIFMFNTAWAYRLGVEEGYKVGMALRYTDQSNITTNFDDSCTRQTDSTDPNKTKLNITTILHPAESTG